jgi:uncharacterized protein YxjI
MKSYLVQQKIRAFVNQYDVFEASADGQPGARVGFAQQKRLAFKEKFTVYSDESKQTVAFMIQARSVIDLGARYDVFDASGTLLGTIGKDFKSSLLRSTWHIYAPGQEEQPVMIVQESNQGLAIFRRLWDFLPYLNDIPFFVRYNFDFIDTASQQIVATYTKTTTFRDHYRLDITGGVAEQADPRLLISLGIMLDALQSR